MDGFLIKPLDREKLAEALAGLAAVAASARHKAYSRRSATVSTT